MKFLKQAALSALAAAAVFGATQASATTLTFDSLTATDYTAFSSYAEAGYTFTLVTGVGASVGHIGDGTYQAGTLNWHDGYDNGTGSYLRLTRTDNAAFDLLSFDFQTADVGHTLALTGSGSQSLSLVGALTLATASPAWTNVTYVDFVPSTSGAGIDNVNVQLASAVPEPETYAMLLMGLGAVGFIGKRRKS